MFCDCAAADHMETFWNVLGQEDQFFPHWQHKLLNWGVVDLLCTDKIPCLVLDSLICQWRWRCGKLADGVKSDPRNGIRPGYQGGSGA